MNSNELEAYLHKQIPASKALAISVKSCSEDKIELLAPLEPNINHKNTAFGGSISALAILSGWSLLFMRLQGVRNEIVIQESSMSFLAAAKSTIEASSHAQFAGDWDKLTRAFSSRGKGRIAVRSEVSCEGEIVAQFQGTYVAFNKELLKS